MTKNIVKFRDIFHLIYILRNESQSVKAASGIWLGGLNTLHGITDTNPDSKVHGDNMGPAWVLSVRDVPHVGPMNPAIRV